MSDIALRVENLGKQYRIGAVQRNGGRRTYKSLRDTIANAASVPVRAVRNMARGGPDIVDNREEIFWALRDVSFEVKKGEVVGVIGRNGAGKSTLLKILSRITEPTTGRVEVHGRVGSLLEVGTGFHPELTGRDNVYMNGAILGMKRAEIARQFDEIVAFAEVEKFIDTPVKHYSSGMYLRLAFAVAAHLDPEVLLVDEVLAVGDADFQKKCLSKMGSVARSGRTVMFVSHNLAAIRKLCPTTILLATQKPPVMGNSVEILSLYKNGTGPASSDQEAGMIYHKDHDPYRPYQIGAIEIFDFRGSPTVSPSTWEDVTFRIHFYVETAVKRAAIQLIVQSEDSVNILHCSTTPDSRVLIDLDRGFQSIDCRFPQLPLAAGQYFVVASITIPNVETLAINDDSAILTVTEKDVFNSGYLCPSIPRCLVATPHSWSNVSQDHAANRPN